MRAVGEGRARNGNRAEGRDDDGSGERQALEVRNISHLSISFSGSRMAARATFWLGTAFVASIPSWCGPERKGSRVGSKCSQPPDAFCLHQAPAADSIRSKRLTGQRQPLNKGAAQNRRTIRRSASQRTRSGRRSRAAAAEACARLRRSESRCRDGIFGAWQITIERAFSAPSQATS